MSQVLVKPGDVIVLGAAHKVYAEVPLHFLYSNRQGDFSLGRGLADLAAPHFSYLHGRYVVVNVALDGGSDDPGARDPYPNGHHVWCESIDRKHAVDFYQTGCFTAKNEDVLIVGCATLRWVVES